MDGIPRVLLNPNRGQYVSLANAFRNRPQSWIIFADVNLDIDELEKIVDARKNV